ncbi:protein PF3D7_1417600 [Battus philenor]|uniref:protein PF3D7_1417600 n=1 Tax=Battus philenor TaxID=42288 RepID=UPI0035CFE038
MGDIKQVKVDNWGIYFLQRLKHFFNRTDYCDLTLQFQDNAQLKVHRLVLSACTEYFELLERTCEMYEDCLVMPDDLQADVVVPIVNFMYTGQLDFKPDSLERLYQTSQVMNMPVLTKLLDAHRNQQLRLAPTHDYRNIKSYSKTVDSSKNSKSPAVASTSNLSTKRSYSNAFENNAVLSKNKKLSLEKNVSVKPEKISNNNVQQSSNMDTSEVQSTTIKKDCRPTRYELPEELDVENVFDNSFTSISYTSTPLMVHPETVKRYSSKKNNIFDDASGTKRFVRGTSTVDIVECKKISNNENIFEDDISVTDDIFSSNNPKEEHKDANQLFDQILESDNLKSSIEIKDTEKSQPKLDHAKIISEVLKKYPHLVKGNKNIKLKILNTPNKSKKSKSNVGVFNEEKDVKQKVEPPDFTYETDVLDSKEAAKLIAMGAENVKGPWICLICGTPGRALHFTSYYKFRRHLVEVHNEKPIPNICEYCGLKSLKRNYILHHLYTKHGVEPPPHYHFPKCNYCSYVALTKAYLVKHKLTHIENKNFGCDVCAASFNTSNQLLIHIQKTGHKYSAERKISLQCIYCLKTFSRETNLYTHLKNNHKQLALSDGIIDDSDEEKAEEERPKTLRLEKFKSSSLKYDLSSTYDSEYENLDIQYQIQQKPDGNIQVLSKSPQTLHFTKHKILNPGFNLSNKSPQNLKTSTTTNKQELNRESTISLINNDNEGIVMIDGAEYIVKDNQLVPRPQNNNEEFLLSNVTAEHDDTSLPTASVHQSAEFPNVHHATSEGSKMLIKKTTHLNQPIQIVVSNEEEYKALMSSNHSIIFEEGDTSKTLTVLTAPQNSTLEGSTIDLDTTQSNDMMIIQENYPLNVSETVTAANSNIVVVYSHPVDDQNKQFQYVTSQGIEAQFIQSSAMITHSFETVSTSTPVMSANVINTPVDESWQTNVKQAIESVPIESHLQAQLEVPNEEQLAETSQNSTSNIHSIEGIGVSKPIASTITTNVSNGQEAITQVTLENTNNILVNNVKQVLIQEVANLPNLTVPTEQLVHKEIQTESINDNCNLMEVEENMNNEKMIGEKHNEQEAVRINNDELTPNVHDTNVQENSIPEGNITLKHLNITQVPVNNIEVTITNLARDSNSKIEWHNEDKNISEPVEILNNTAVIVSPKIEPLEADNSVFVEESIENIQQEMAKQMEAIATEHNAMQYNEPQDSISAIQPNIDIDTVVKEIGVDNAINTNFNVKESTPQDSHDEATVSILTNEQLCSVPLPDSAIDKTETIENTDKTIENISANKDSNDESLIEQQDSITVESESSLVTTSKNEINESDSIEAKTDNKEISSHKIAIENNTDSSQINKSKYLGTHTVITLNKTAHDKISSLLNDWEDNDSQEEDSQNDHETDLTNQKEEELLQNNQETSVLEKCNEPSNDKIKSLVSDWDDDDDEEESK